MGIPFSCPSMSVDDNSGHTDPHIRQQFSRTVGRFFDVSNPFATSKFVPNSCPISSPFPFDYPFFLLPCILSWAHVWIVSIRNMIYIFLKRSLHRLWCRLKSSRAHLLAFETSRCYQCSEFEGDFLLCWRNGKDHRNGYHEARMKSEVALRTFLNYVIIMVSVSLREFLCGSGSGVTRD